MYVIVDVFINKIKKTHRKLKIKNFYIRKANKNKSVFGVILDNITKTIMINFIVVVFTYTITKDYLFSFFVFVQFFILFMLIAYKVKKNKYKAFVKKINYELVNEKILNDLNNMSKFEFKEYVKEILDKSKIKDLRITNQNDIDIVGRVSNDSIGIKCIKHDLDYKISINDIKEFIIELKKMNFKMGIIITNGYYSDDVKDVIRKIEKHKKIFLVNFDYLMTIIRELRIEPSKRDIRSIILDRDILNNDKNRLKLNREKVFSSKKSLRYFGFGFVIYLFGKAFSLRLYYSLTGYVLMVFGLVSIGNYLFKAIGKLK